MLSKLLVCLQFNNKRESCGLCKAASLSSLDIPCPSGAQCREKAGFLARLE